MADDFFTAKQILNRSEEEEKIAKILGDKKEDFDYYKNILFRVFSPAEAIEDKKHDLEVNRYGLEQGRKERLFPSGRTSKEVCKEKYNTNRLLNDY